MEIRQDNLAGSATQTLLQRHMNEMEASSPPGSCHYLDLDGLRAPEVSFWSIRDGENIVGCGALKQLDASHGEIKSMHVHSDARGKGIAEMMLKHILQVARQRAYGRLSLETGAMAAFIPARRLYEKYGFKECPAFADYKTNPHSIFMTKEL